MSAQILAPDDWISRRRAHESRVSPWIEPRLARTSLGEQHPVDDFLFEYYSYRPGQLRRWHPGLGIVLAGAEAAEFLAMPHYEQAAGGVTAGLASFKPERLAFVRWLLALLETVRDRPPFLGCAGLHEWAMAYRTEEVRHSRWPLRLGAEGTAGVLESLPVRCSHFDAFRFFTGPARPLNRLQPSRESIPFLEQPGCLHANMDLYKWSYKLAPFTPSELVADAFALARNIREVDMRASPYDFGELGFPPICIETFAGRCEYEMHQREFAAQAVPIRARLIEVVRALLTAAEAATDRFRSGDNPVPKAS